MQHGSTLLKAWMERARLNQREAAVVLALNYTMLNKLLRGVRCPGRQSAVHLQRVAGVPVEAWESTTSSHAKKRTPWIGRNR